MSNGINNVTFNAQPTPVAKNERKNRILPALATDIGIGGVTGGLIGLTSRPWQQNGQLTDEFVGTVMNDIADKLIPDAPKDINLGKYFGLNIKEGMSKEALIDVIEKNAEAFGYKDIDKTELRKVLENEFKEAGAVDDFIKNVESTKKIGKDAVTKAFSDVKKGTLRQIENATEDQKSIQKFLKDTIKKMKTSAALSWAVIGAIAMAGTGLIVNLIARKAQAKKNVQ